MTNKEYLIGRLHEHISFVDRKTIEVIFEAINKRDWAVFCSQMGDYDHPSERVQAGKELEAQIEKMKRCENCKHFDFSNTRCKKGWCNNFEKWELSEVEFIDLKEIKEK